MVSFRRRILCQSKRERPIAERWRRWWCVRMPFARYSQQQKNINETLVPLIRCYAPPRGRTSTQKTSIAARSKKWHRSHFNVLCSFYFVLLALNLFFSSVPWFDSLFKFMQGVKSARSLLSHTYTGLYAHFFFVRSVWRFIQDSPISNHGTLADTRRASRGQRRLYASRMEKKNQKI